MAEKKTDITVNAGGVEASVSTNENIENVVFGCIKGLSRGIGAIIPIFFEELATSSINAKKNIKECLNIANARIDSTVTDVETNTTKSLKENPDLIPRLLEETKLAYSKEARALWGSTLAEEIKKPNSIDPAIIEFIKGLTKRTKNIFSTFCHFVLDNSSVVINLIEFSKSYYFQGGNPEWEEFDIMKECSEILYKHVSKKSIQDLFSAGLIIDYKPSNDIEDSTFCTGTHVKEEEYHYVFTCFSGYKLSNMGRELFKIIDFKNNNTPSELIKDSDDFKTIIKTKLDNIHDDIRNGIF